MASVVLPPEPTGYEEHLSKRFKRFKRSASSSIDTGNASLMAAAARAEEFERRRKQGSQMQPRLGNHGIQAKVLLDNAAPLVAALHELFNLQVLNRALTPELATALAATPAASSAAAPGTVGELITQVLHDRAHPYRCLGLGRGASVQACRKRYLALVMRLHPDKTDHELALAAFTAVERAYALIASWCAV